MVGDALAGDFSSGAERKTGWLRRLPGLVALRNYEPAWLTHDVVAGIVLTTMLAPVGVAYAVASGVGAIYGLYATIAGLLAYAVFGPSRILVLGPDSSLAAVIIGVVAPLSAGDPNRAIALAGVMALVSGAVACRGRDRPARLRDRPPVEADPLRLHERNRADCADQPDTQTARVQDHERRTFAGPMVDRRRDRWRQGQLDRVRAREPRLLRRFCW